MECKKSLLLTYLISGVFLFTLCFGDLILLVFGDCGNGVTMSAAPIGWPADG